MKEQLAAHAETVNCVLGLLIIRKKNNCTRLTIDSFQILLSIRLQIKVKVSSAQYNSLFVDV